jgi:biopolymer transport protein TolR
MSETALRAALHLWKRGRSVHRIREGAMAASVGVGRGGIMAGINMTPMIDVLLVLLIIFMVVQADLQKGLGVQVPSPEPASVVHPSPPESMVLEVEPGGRFALNHQPLDGTRLAEELRAIFAPRPRKVLFVKASEQLTYAEVISAVDASREAGIDVISLVPRK